MPANWELQLIATIVRGVEDTPAVLFERAQALGVRHEWFGQLEAKSVWARLVVHYNRPTSFGHIPSECALCDIFPSLELPDSADLFEDVCAFVRESYLKRRTDALINNYQRQASENVVEALEDLHTKLASLKEQVEVAEDASFKDAALGIITSHLRATRDNNGIVGIPWPWTKLNEETGGMRPGDFILVWAMPKSMKTFWSLIVAANLLQSGYRVLVYSKEMGRDAIMLRIAAIISRTDYGRMLKGQLTNIEQETLLEAAAVIADPAHTGELIFTRADRLDGSVGGPAEIRKKIEVHHPHFVLLDSSYMLEMPNIEGSPLDWKNLAALTRALKQVCITTKVPMIAILQENETQALKYKNTRGTASLAMNKGAVMDCDLGIRLVIHKKRKELSIHFAAGREICADGFTIHADACSNFDYAHDHLHQVGDDFDDDSKEANDLIAASSIATAMEQLARLVIRVPNATINDFLEAP